LTLSAFVQHKVLAKRLVAVAGKSINVRSFFGLAVCNLADFDENVEAQRSIYRIDGTAALTPSNSAILATPVSLR
jgi:hypothetical protein